MGVLQVPVAGEGDEPRADLIEVSHERSHKIIEWVVERENLPPELPAIEPDKANQKVLTKSIVPFAPTVAGDGRTRVYRIAGKYVHGLRRPIKTTDDLPMGHLSALSSPPIKPSDFKEGVTTGAANRPPR